MADAVARLFESLGATSALETHISRLFFAADRVFKVKKALRLAFLDYSTLERRQHACEEEVRLGRRVAGTIYRGVVALTRSTGDALALGGTGEVAEYAVEMERLPERGLLDRRLAAGEVDNDLLERVLARLVDFEAEAARGPEIARHGSPGAIAALLLGNLRELRDLAPEAALTPERAQFLGAYLARALAELRPLLQRRFDEGRVREGHGDLHAGNVCDLGDQIVFYDCIEFAPALRCLDVAAEVSFLAMDVEARGYPAFAAWLCRRAPERLLDPGMAPLLPLYVVHYALVRAKVALLTARDAAACATARRYVDLATARALGPVLLLTCGLPGTGKSTVAAALAHALHLRVFRSDVVRKELAGMAAHERDRAEDQGGIYAPDMSVRTYDALLQRARAEVERGHGVIVDAASPTPARRAPFRSLAEERAIPRLCLELSADPAAVADRLRRRAADPAEASDAGIEVHRALAGRFVEPREWPAPEVLAVSSTAAGDETAHAVLEALARQRGGAASPENAPPPG